MSENAGYSLLDSKVQINMDETTKDFFDQIGRTEDIRFSSDNKKLAIAGFLENFCIILDIDIEWTGQKPVVNVIKGIKIQSSKINEPHGIELIDNDYLIVANRSGFISLFDIKNLPLTSSHVTLSPIKVIKNIGLLKRLNSPGSICILNSKVDEIYILACNNYSHQISRHVIPLKNRFKFVKNDIFLKNGFDIPDGIAINKDKSWIAISDHGTNRVLMFNHSSGLASNSVNTGELIDAGYPHGVRFSDDGKMIFVADAGSPFVNVYQSQTGIWYGEHSPIKKLRVLSEDAFIRGHANPEEGGPKGIDISSDGTLLVSTSKEAPLDIFYIKDVKY